MFDVRYDTLAELNAAYEREIRHGGGFVPAAEGAPDIFTRVGVHFHLPQSANVVIHARVVNVIPGRGVFVQFERGEELDALISAIEFVQEVSGQMELAAPPAPAPDPEPEQAVTVEPLMESKRRVWELVDLASEIPLAEQLAALSSREKAKLAKHGSRPIRSLLIRDGDLRMHEIVVRNPKISRLEILEYAALPGTAPEALRWIAHQRRYMRVPQVVSTLVQNPATPRDIAETLLMTLPQSELQRVAQSITGDVELADIARQRLRAVGR